MSSVALSRAVEAIGLGGLKVTNDPGDELVCLGIGSCIAIGIYDPGSGVAGMAHLVLPESIAGRDDGENARFVDTGIPLLVQGMEARGASRTRMVVKIAGGAHMIARAGVDGESIGDRNTVSTRQTLSALGMTIAAEDVGGTCGRTVRLYADSGVLVVSSAGTDSREL